MRSLLPVLLVAVLVAIVGAPALAVPSLGGPTGLALLPTADIAPVDEWQTAFGYRSLKVEAGALGMYEDLDVSDWQLSFLKGVASDAEIWVTFQRATNGEDANVWRIGGKYEVGDKLLPRSGFLSDTKIAIGGGIGRYPDDAVSPTHFFGVTNPTFATDTETLDFYFVVTKQLTPGGGGTWEWEEPTGTRVIGTGGLYYMDVDFDDLGGETLFEPFFGIAFVTPKDLTLAFEYRTKAEDLEDDALFSYLLRYPVDKSTTVEFGLTNGSPIGLAQVEHDVFARLTYSFPVSAY
ncbi:MAG: hypothetical protein JXA57_01565 [Armatimonadetes bacterium]|nr:hypothetical protein [Armatimonadota bacterium]